MVVVCGTDFSEGAGRALRAAAALARAAGEPLVLSHVLDLPGAQDVLSAGAPARVTEFFVSERARLMGLLEEAARPLRADGLEVRCEVPAGRADEALLALGAGLQASLLVVGAVGLRGHVLWHLGSTAERLAQSSRQPVLAVRNAQPLEAFARGQAALRVVVGVDPGETAAVALRWSAGLARLGRIELVAAHVYWPPDLHERAGGRGGLQIGPGRPASAETLERELRARVATELGAQEFELRLIGGMGRPGGHLAQVASEERAGLLVVGTHQRQGAARFWHGSVSRDAIVHAETNVTCTCA